MTKKQYIKIFDNYLSDKFALNNFVPYQNPNEAGYICRIKNGDVYFMGLGYYSWWNEITGKRDAFRIDPYVVISISEIEKEYKKITVNKFLKHEIDYRTITTNAASIIAFPDGIIKGVGHNRLDWLIQQESDVTIVAEKVWDCFKEVILPYIQFNASVIGIDYLFNNNLDKFIIHDKMYRPTKGIIAAKLVGRKNISELIQYYDMEIKDWSDATQQEYIKLKDILPTIGNIPVS